MDTDYRKAANITVIAAGIAALAWLIFKYALGALIPFILAAAVGAVISPWARKISKKTKLPVKLTAAVLVLAFFGLLCLVLYFAVSRLLVEIGNLIDRLSADPELISRTVQSILDKLNSKQSRLGLLRGILSADSLIELGIDVPKLTDDALQSILSAAADALSSAVMNAITSIPSLILSSVVFLISAFYFSADTDRIFKGMSGILPDRWQAGIPSLKSRVGKAVSGYLKAYLLIMLITFLEVFVGLSLMKVNYAFILAIVIAVVDVLPVLGTGAVLVPWSIFAFLSSNTKLGIGLIILYAVTLVVRQLIEPRLIGSTLGLHPLVTLASVYLGLELLGFAGIFIGPIIAMLLFRREPEAVKTD